MSQSRIVGWAWVAISAFVIVWRVAQALVPGSNWSLPEVLNVVGSVVLFAAIGAAGWRLRSGVPWARAAIAILSVALIGITICLAVVLLTYDDTWAFMGYTGWAILGVFGFLMPAYSLAVIIRDGRDTHLTSAST